MTVQNNQTQEASKNHVELVDYMIKSYKEAAQGALINKNNKLNNNRLTLASNFLYNLMYLYKDQYRHLLESQQSLMHAILRSTSFPGRIYYGITSQIAILMAFKDFESVVRSLDEETLNKVLEFMDKNTKYSHYINNCVATTHKPKKR